MSRGVITTQFTVWCGTCTEWTQISARTKKQASEVFCSEGWNRFKSCGWTCPQCAKKKK